MARKPTNPTPETSGAQRPRRSKATPAPEQPQSGDDLSERVGQGLAEGIGRVLQGWINGLNAHREDLAGIALLVFTLYTLLALFGPLFGLGNPSGEREQTGIVLTTLGDMLTSWLGWGALFVPLLTGGLGILLLARRFNIHVPVKWGRVLVFELTIIAALTYTHLLLANLAARASQQALLTVMQSPDFVQRTAEGEGGGRLGWVLGLLLAEAIPFGALLWGLFFLIVLGLLVSFGFNLGHIWRGLYQLQVRLGINELPSDPAESVAPDVATAFAGVPRAGAVDAEVTVKPPKADTTQRPTAAPDLPLPKPRRRRKTGVMLPSLDLLQNSGILKPDERLITRYTTVIEQTLQDFGAPSRVIDYSVGPSVTQFAVEPGYTDDARTKKVRVSQIAALSNDLALALAASKVRIQAPVPGTGYVGIEVPNASSSLVTLRTVLESKAFAKKARPLTIALGLDVAGAPMAADLSKMPHLLIAGTTGSGKSVAIVSLITCLVMNNPPDRLRLVMIDPKKVELTRFEGLPHVLGRVEHDYERIVTTLRWVTREMDRRYKLLSEVGYRDIESYNESLDPQSEQERLPYIVVFVDELADLMLTSPEETERTLVRLAQMARAVGIHLVVATQRPSVDIVTGLIKANFPSRISFAVASSIDSRVILDEVGAEALLGKGDMLYLAADASGARRLQGVFVSDDEVDAVVKFWRDQWVDQMIDTPSDLTPTTPKPTHKEAPHTLTPPGSLPAPSSGIADSSPWDPMLARDQVLADKDDDLERAIELVKQYGTASASLLQRKLRVGYPRAARLMDELQEMGIVGDAVQGGKTRNVLINPEDDPISDAANQILDGDDDQ